MENIGIDLSFEEGAGRASVNPSLKGLSNRDLNLKTAELIRQQIGDIEEIRLSLGLSKRKICQLLLIDPSTWTRWTSGKTAVPPHIYRCLQWGLAVMDKYPEVHPLGQQSQFEALKATRELTKDVETLKKELRQKKGLDAVKKARPKPWVFLVLFSILAHLLLATLWK